VALPTAYAAVLEQLGCAFLAYRDETGSFPVLVGGAATALGTAGQFMSADFDVVADDTDAFARAMIGVGFIKEAGIGHLAGGFYHPDHAEFVVELVSGQLFDGKAEHDRLVRLRIKDHSEIIVPAVEDLIADRLAQHAVASSSDTSRLLQARALFACAPKVDMTYLTRRVLEEGGDPELLHVTR